MKHKLIAASFVILASASVALADDATQCEAYYSNDEYLLALEPCTAAAELGNAEAQTYLGLMYEFGLGVTQNYAEAVRWYRAAAEQGDAVAQNDLGWMYEQGLGVVQNYAQAHMWFNIAAANGVREAAENRNRVAALMTAKKIAEAQTRASQCLDSNYTDC